VYLPGVIRCAAPRERLHQTEKPLDLMRQLVRICRPGGLVLDPFAGSGSCGHAALLEGRRYLGIEMSDGYAAAARDRIEFAHRATVDAANQSG
jgi:site-specific DNA-methyltransferase (adenine-specific)